MRSRQHATGVSFSLTEEQKELRRAGARLRCEGDPPAVEHEYDEAHAPSRRSDREGARARSDEPPRPDGVRRPRPLRVRRDARRRGAQLGLLGHRHLDLGATASAPGPRSSPASDEQKRRVAARRCIEQPILCSFGLSEPGAGSDVASAQDDRRSRGRRVRPQRLEDASSRTRATRTGRSSSRRPTRRRAQRGMSAFIVPMDTPGVTIEQHLDKMGQRATDTSAFALQDVRHPGREPPRRGGRRLQDRDADARLHASGHGDRRGRRRAGRVRARRASTRRSASPSTCRSRCTRASTS